MTAMEKQQIRSDIMFRWIRLGQIGISLEKLLKERGYKDIGVYGYISLTDCIVYELMGSKEVKLKCIIDQKGDKILIDFPAVKPTEIERLNLDVIVLMPVDDYEPIKKQLEKYTDADIKTIEEILYEL